MLAIGKFAKQEITTSLGTPLEFYLRDDDAKKLEPTNPYRRQLFDFFEREIGEPDPWGVYRQIPALDFLYGGM